MAKRTQKEEVFWKKNPMGLITRDNWRRFLPKKGMSPTQTLNSLSRFILYLGIAAWAYTQRNEVLLLVGLGLLATIVFYERADLIFQTDQEEGLADESDESLAQGEVREEARGEARVMQQIINSTSVNLGESTASQPQPRPLGGFVPAELFDPNQGRTEITAQNDGTDKYGAKPQMSVETNGLPHDNQPGQGVLPTFDLRPGAGQECDPMQSQLVMNKATDANGNHLRSEPAPASINDAFCMGDRLGDNIRRDPNVHCQQVVPDSVGCKAGSIVPGGPGMGVTAGCQPSTPNNPFGNILPTDYVADPTRGPACPDRNAQDNNWSQGLFRNVNDVWDRNNGQLIFNTQPATTIPNDRDSFQKWLYQYPYVCKDGDLEACYGIDEMQTRRHGAMQ